MQPRTGHIEAAIRVFGYLKKFIKGQILIDPVIPDMSHLNMVDCDNWKEFYPDLEEELPYDMLKPKGKPAQITIYVDADHARDKVTQRSITGVIVLVNGTIVRTFCKRQSTVETSTYGSEMIAARIATEFGLVYRYALRRLGVPLLGPNLMLGDNKSVIISCTFASSVLKKKHQACAWHRVREAIAGKIVKFCHIDSKLNLADILTKPLNYTTAYPLLQRSIMAKPEIDRFPARIEDIVTEEMTEQKEEEK